MLKGLVARKEIEINAEVSAVWDALINPELIKQYLFGTEAISEWKIGSPIVFRGVWEGKTYVDKGLIFELKTNRIFGYYYWSPFSGLEDKLENYANITYELTKDGEQTILAITQDSIETEDMVEQASENWQNVLKSLKETVEKKFGI